MPQSAPSTATQAWMDLLELVAAGGQRLVLETGSGARAVLLAESEVEHLEAAAAHGAGGRGAVVLTPREREVLQLVGSGLSGADAAARLGVAVNTVAQHLAAVRRKYGVRTTAAALEVARTAGQDV